jgi:hypothetical protein
MSCEQEKGIDPMSSSAAGKTLDRAMYYKGRVGQGEKLKRHD